MKRPKCDRCLYYQMQCKSVTPCSYFYSLDDDEQFEIECERDNGNEYKKFCKEWLVYASEYDDYNFS